MMDGGPFSDLLFESIVPKKEAFVSRRIFHPRFFFKGEGSFFRRIGRMGLGRRYVFGGAPETRTSRYPFLLFFASGRGCSLPERFFPTPEVPCRDLVVIFLLC